MQPETTSRTSIFSTRAQLILASASPRRRELLEMLGLTFTVRVADTEERPLGNETPQAFVLRAATDKARAVARHNPEAWVLGADTVVVLNNLILGKPTDRVDAQRLLVLLADRWHEVRTGFCLYRKSISAMTARTVVTAVKFAHFSDELAAAYVQTGEPLDKAGAYGIQGIGGFLVERINGSYSNVVGLPLAEVIEELLEYGIIAPIAGPEGNNIP